MEGRRADLLFAFHEHPHVARQRTRRAEPRLDGGGVRDRAGLVVGGAAAEEAAGALDRFERLARPPIDDTGRLHIVVCVQQHGRAIRTIVPYPLADHVGVRAIDAREPHMLETRAFEHRGGCIGTGTHVGDAVGIGTDARDADERFELGARVGHTVLDRAQRVVDRLRR